MENNIAEILILLLIITFIAILLYVLFGRTGTNHFSTAQKIVFAIKDQFADSQLGT